LTELRKHLISLNCDCCGQVVSREEKPYFEITVGEHPEYVAPEDVAKLIFNKMKGSHYKTNAHFANKQ